MEHILRLCIFQNCTKTSLIIFLLQIPLNISLFLFNYIFISLPPSLPHLPAPEFKQFPEDARALVGEGVLFQVKVTGSPPPKLVWYHDGEEVVPDYSREIMKDGSLTMPSVEVKHTGTYKVVAENVAGKKEGEVKLYVEDDEGKTKPKQGNNKPPLKTKDIPVTKFGRHVVQNHSKNNKAFKDEYDVRVFVSVLVQAYVRPVLLHISSVQDLYDGTAKSIAFATTPKNKLKNRFANICVCK